MINIRTLSACVFVLTLAGCNSPEVGAAASELKTAAKSAAGDAFKEASSVAGGLMTTRNACLMAGQSEVFCGCLNEELGEKLDPSHVSGLTEALKASLGGDIEGALKEASSIDPQTRSALATCTTRAAIAGAVGQ